MTGSTTTSTAVGVMATDRWSRDTTSITSATATTRTGMTGDSMTSMGGTTAVTTIEGLCKASKSANRQPHL